MIVKGTDPNEAAVIAIAQDLASAAPFALRSGATDIGEAYRLQDALTAHLVEKAIRGPVAGYKLAVNSQAQMERFGVTEPASGRIFADQLYQSPAELPAAGFRQFAYEPEIAAVMSASLPAQEAPFTLEHVAAAIARFVPALELLDLRDSEMPKIGLPEAVAQNITNAGIVIGGPGVPPSELAPKAIETVVTIDDGTELTISGAAPQHPLEAVTWLANHLASRGFALEAGQVVLCGTHAPIRPVEGTARIELRMSGLGTARLTLT